EGTDLVERRREGDKAVARDTSVGRLDADDATQRRRLADGPTCVGPKGSGDEASRHRRGASTAGAARHPRGVVRIACGPERRVLRGRTHGKLVEVRLADHDGAGFGQAGNDRGVVWRSPVLENAG